MTDIRSPSVTLADDTPLPAVEAQASSEVIAAMPAAGPSLPVGVVWDTREARAAPVSHAAAPAAAMLAIPVTTAPALPVDAAAASYDQAAATTAASAAYERERVEDAHAAEAAAVIAAEQALAADKVAEDRAAEDRAAEEKAAADKAAADKAAEDKTVEDQAAADRATADKAAADAAQRDAQDAPYAVPPIESVPAPPRDDAPIPTVADTHPVAADAHVVPHPDAATDHSPALAGDDHS